MWQKKTPSDPQRHSSIAGTRTERASPPMTMLTVSDVSYTFGHRPVLSNVSFAVPAGQVALLLGPNGAGKTTLFSLIVRLLALRHGDIAIDEQSIKTADSAIMRNIGIVFQQPALDLDLTVRQNLS